MGLDADDGEEERKRWWRYVAIAVVGGGLAVGGWVKFMRPATAEPAPKLTAAVDDQTYPDRGAWSRSSRSMNQLTVPSSRWKWCTCSPGPLPQILAALQVLRDQLFLRGVPAQ